MQGCREISSTRRRCESHRAGGGKVHAPVSGRGTAATVASAAPQPHVVYARSCSDCSETAFCEFGFPGTPEDHVACVQHAGARSLCKRYDAPVTYTECAGNQVCCQSTGSQVAGSATDQTSCAAACTARTGCTHWVLSFTTCTSYTSCTKYSNQPQTSLRARDPAACPTSTCVS
ncbi:hypothetical protein DFJ74DRAFT_532015 [Hyaloraphidium curvatum]|nr:hypothetical protein DFJ74DRAFT_532015 [Hyaloraphidium curvatum]